MIKKEEVYKIGLFNKPHGIPGELQFTFTDDIFDRVDCDYLVCLLDGIFVPFFMEEYRFRSDSTALVKLEGVDTAERARMFTNVEVYFPMKHAEEAGEGELSIPPRLTRFLSLKEKGKNCLFPRRKNLSGG